MILRRACLALFGFVFAFAAMAQNSGPATGKPGADGPAKSFLWEVKSGDHTLYIFGAPGLGNADLYPVSFWAEAAYTRSQVLALETDLSDEARFQQEAAVMYYPKDDNLAAHIYRTLFEDVADYHVLQGLPMSGTDHLKPYAVAFGLMNKEAKTVGLDPYFDAPFYFSAKAKADQKPIVEIEGVARQLQALEAMPMPLQEELLKDAVERAAKGNWGATLQTEVSTWKAGDVDYYDQLDVRSYADMPHGAEIRHLLLESRHPAMADKLAGYLGSGKIYFAVVSAAHLVGPNSLLDELTRRGYRVQRL